MSLLHDQKVSLKRQRFKCHNGQMRASCVCEFLVRQDQSVAFHSAFDQSRF